MTVSIDFVRDLFRGGRFIEIAERFGSRTYLDRADPELRILAAHALFHVAQVREAERMAREESAIGSAPQIRAHGEQILGLLARRKGEIDVARSHFHTAIQLGKDCGDHKRIAWTSLQLFRALAESEPAGAIAGMLPQVRNCVARAADFQITAYLHDSIALMEVANGRLGEAQRHIRLARSLLDAEPNAWLQQVVEISSFFVAYLESDYGAAAEHLRRAKKLLSVTGDQDRALIECNEGHLLITTGKYKAAIRRLQQVAESDAVRPALAAIEGMARAYLATGELDLCDEVLRRYEDGVSKAPAIDAEFVGRWTGVTRVKLLLRQRRYTLALAHASECLTEARRREDRLLVAFLGALRTEALALSADISTASQQIVSVAAAETSAVTPGQYGSFCRAGAVLVGESDPTLALIVSGRARRVWEDEGNTCAVSELEAIGENAGSISPLVDPRVGAAIVGSLAGAFTLVGRTKLLAREIETALRIAGFSRRIEILESDRNRKLAAQDESLCCLDVGEQDGTKVTLAVEIPTTPAEAMLVSDVLRLAKAATALEKFSRQDRDRAALWPADPIETEAGALFLAEEMQGLLTTARRIAPTTVPVLLTGETGTGKEVLARLIHAYSNRAKAIFQPFNCSAVPKEMLDSQLFGHRRGSFTGAADNFAGVIRAAAGGTLFLDEIGETTFDVQPKLLRFLESSEVHPIGELHPTRVDVRLIAATNADLNTLVSQGRFREDLFYRLNIVRLHLPPLRERRVEIPVLANHYLRKHAIEYGKGDLRLSEETMEFLVLYRWPGNVRQLANEMRRLAALAESGAVLMPEHLSADIAASRRTIPASERTLEPTEVVVRLDQPMAAAVQHIETALILHALKQTGGNMEDTAALLGVSRKGLYLKRNRYGIDLPAQPGGLAIA
jgi:DNA-binding NtrC family response regulator